MGRMKPRLCYPTQHFQFSLSACFKFTHGSPVLSFFRLGYFVYCFGVQDEDPKYSTPNIEWDVLGDCHQAGGVIEIVVTIMYYHMVREE